MIKSNKRLKKLSIELHASKINHDWARLVQRMLCQETDLKKNIFAPKYKNKTHNVKVNDGK